jgi:AraC family transcriptional regulator, regulatory protein of adaptative response / methylated-DNA-[protein]-cysteine methyltransferase
MSATMAVLGDTGAAEPPPAPRFGNDEARWAAFEARDPAADGAFIVAVHTTGIYCRPTCPARRPKRENVSFFETPEAAGRAGYRACLRCGPDRVSPLQARTDAIAAACRLIEAAETPPRLDELAKAAGLSPHHFHRLFKAATGVTPAAYAAARRREKVKARLQDAPTVTNALYAAGYNASSRFYAESDAGLGMAPSAYRKGGAGSAIRYAIAPSSLCLVLVAATEKGIAAIQLGEDEAELIGTLHARFPAARIARADETFADTVGAVLSLVENPERSLDLPLDIAGTAFQERVWQALRRIPPGTTATYAEIARVIGAPRAVRAVGAACGANRLALAIPCHRVLRGDGALGGYRWGVQRKRALLDREVASPADTAVREPAG